VCDRTNDRLQVFQKDGTFVEELFIARKTVDSGSVWGIAFSTDAAQSFLMVPDGINERVWIVRRHPLAGVGGFGSAGHYAGQFFGAHNIAEDSKGNLYIAETYEGKRPEVRQHGTRPRHDAALTPVIASAAKQSLPSHGSLRYARDDRFPSRPSRSAARNSV
jgi:hypothetical protein